MFANPPYNPSTLFKSYAKTRIFRLSFDLQVFFSCAQQYPKFEQEIRFIYPVFFCKIRSLPKTYKRKSKGIRSGVSNIFISVIIPN